MKQYKISIIVIVFSVLLYLSAVLPFAPHSVGRGMAGSGMVHGATAAREFVTHNTGTAHPAGNARLTSISGKSVNDLFSQNAILASKLENYLELSGPDALSELQAEAAGFENLGQFIAAVHASQNLGIPFDDLKGAMVQNGKQVSRLGKAIRWFKPDTQSVGETRKANKQAGEDLKGEEST
jgi:hypothetical protein